MLKHSKLMMETHKPMEYYGILWGYMEVRLAWKLGCRVSSSIYGDVTGCTADVMPRQWVAREEARVVEAGSIQIYPKSSHGNMMKHVGTYLTYPRISTAYDQWSYLI
jgi:hypothetical protein